MRTLHCTYCDLHWTIEGYLDHAEPLDSGVSSCWHLQKSRLQLMHPTGISIQARFDLIELDCRAIGAAAIDLRDGSHQDGAA
jgi:hypothetical protein